MNSEKGRSSSDIMATKQSDGATATIEKKKNKKLPLDDLSCARPACDDVKAMFQRATAHMEGTRKQSVEAQPPTKGQIGKAGWTLLHSMAAWYPDQPTRTEQTYMEQFVNAMAYFYPCTTCARDFQQNIEQYPPKTNSRIDLAQWMCFQHNLVNEKLGKKKYPCDMKTLDRRWREVPAPSSQSPNEQN